jgi:hypothetical protein
MPTLKILSHSIPTPEPYTAGHVCTAAEAAVLNASLTRGLAKGLDRLLRSLQEAGKGEDVVLGEIEDFVAGYLRSFAEGHERLRAIEAEARRLARSRIEAALYRQGKRLSELAPGEQTLAILKEAEREEVLSEAARRIDALRAVGTLMGLEELAEDAG